MKPSLLLLLAVATLAVPPIYAAPPTYKVVSKIKIGGAGRWDYSFVDAKNHRLYVSHGTQTEVIDTTTEKLVATIEGTNGVHGIAIAPDLGRGFTSDGTDNAVTIFDLKTNKVISKVKTGENPDAIIYEPVSQRIFAFNGRSSDATAIDAKTGQVVAASIALGGKPEFSQFDGKGHLYVNIETKNEIVEIDAKNALVSRRYSISPCDTPTGLVFDAKRVNLFSVCENKLMLVSEAATGKVIAMPAIGAGSDGVAFDDGYFFSANGQDGTVTMVAETSKGKFEPVATIPTQRGARTISANADAHKLYLPFAEFAPAEAKGGKQGRPTPIPDSFSILVLGR